MASRTLVSIIHYQTPDLLRQAVDSFRDAYPHTPLLVVDNGSKDGSAEWVASLSNSRTNLAVRLLDENVFHGPAMDLVLRKAESDFVFFLDSDTITRKAGFLEPLEELANQPDVLASGKVVHVDGRGFAAADGIPVPVSAYMTVNRKAYLELPPFVHHGLPVLETCKAAADRGKRIIPFAVDEYVEHLGRGTAERYGYGLGLKSRLSYLLHRLGL